MVLRTIEREPNDTKYHFLVEVLPYGIADE
jgi:hypothetical protein